MKITTRPAYLLSTFVLTIVILLTTSNLLVNAARKELDFFDAYSVVHQLAKGISDEEDGMPEIYGLIETMRTTVEELLKSTDTLIIRDASYKMYGSTNSKYTEKSAFVTRHNLEFGLFIAMLGSGKLNNWFSMIPINRWTVGTRYI